MNQFETISSKVHSDFLDTCSVVMGDPNLVGWVILKKLSSNYTPIIKLVSLYQNKPWYDQSGIQK